MVTDEELDSMTCVEWQNCQHVQCRARREITWLHGEVEDLRSFVDEMRIHVKAAAKLYGYVPPSPTLGKLPSEESK